MAINETISTGNKYRRLKDATNKVWQRLSFWTKASDVEFDNGSTAEEALGSITGITDSVNSTSSNVAASAKAVSTLNSNLTSFQTGVDSLYDQISSLGVTPEGKTLASITASLQSLYDTALASGKTTGYNEGYTAGKSAGTIVSVAGAGSANQNISTIVGELYICTGLGNNVNGNIVWSISGADSLWGTGGNSGGQQYRVNLVRATSTTMYVSCGNHVHSSVVRLVHN